MRKQFALFGAPGVGKGTFAPIICRRGQLQHIAVGDIVRDEIKKKTALGMNMTKYIDNGVLVPDQVICEIVFKEIKKSTRILLDGFPRFTLSL
jgi:adenylate kinase